MNSVSSSQTKQAVDGATVFQWMDETHQYLVETLERIRVSPERGLISRCLYLAHQIQKACEQQPVGVLAALQLNRAIQHQSVKELFVAVLCELIGKELGLQSSSRLYLICAGFTQDLGMLELQQTVLDRQSSPLNYQQQRIIGKHQELGKRLLERCRIHEKLWLKTVMQHHEQPDGHGYPEGLRGSEICRTANILHVADAYVAMVRTRGDRVALTPKEAIKKIFLHRGEQFDTVAARALVNLLGMYPPGTWVCLVSGELGVVSGLGGSHPFPEVAVILGREGEHMPHAVVRHTQQQEYTIIETVRAPFHFNLTPLLNQIWPTIKEGSRAKA